MGFGRTLRSVKSMGRLSGASSSSHRDISQQLEPPYPLLLLTNAPPTETQAYRIKQAIAGAETLLASLEYHGLTKECERCHEFIRVHKQTLSILRHLPPELLQEIFLWLLPTDPHTSLPTRYWTTPSQVCRPWRAAALSAPKLWTYLPSVRLSRKRTEDDAYVAALNVYLTRSGNASLHVRIDAPMREYASPASHPALDALVRHAERWEALQVDTAFQTYLSCFTPLGLQGRFKRLKYLHVDIWRIYSFTIPLLAFQHAPALEEVSIHGAYPHSVVLPYSQIKVYREKVQNHGGLFTVLTQASALQRLEVTRTTECMLDGPVELPCLRTLYMRYDNVVQGDGVLMHLVLPALEDLQVTGCHGEIVPCLRTMLRASLDARFKGNLVGEGSGDAARLPLRRLAFWTKTITPGSLATLLRLTPLLEELDIPCPPSQDAERLVCGPEELFPLIPYLRRLYIRSEGEWGHEGTYKRIAETRSEKLPVDSSSSPATDTVSKLTRRAFVQRLEAFRIIFENPALVMTQQSALEGWFRPSSSDPTYVALLHAKNTLVSELPELVDLPSKGGRSLLKETLSVSGGTVGRRRVDGVLAELEALEVVDVHHIYRSEIHSTLRKLLDLRRADCHIPGDENLKLSGKNGIWLRTRAFSILEKWRPLLEADVEDNYRWVRVGRHSLSYIPSHHPLRSRPDALDKILYGLKDDIHDYDLFWYRYM